MTKLSYVLILTIALIEVSHGQLNEIEFFNRVNSKYYSLQSANLNNFSAWITSNLFKSETGELLEKEVYSLELGCRYHTGILGNLKRKTCYQDSGMSHSVLPRECRLCHIL